MLNWRETLANLSTLQEITVLPLFERQRLSCSVAAVSPPCIVHCSVRVASQCRDMIRLSNWYVCVAFAYLFTTLLKDSSSAVAQCRGLPEAVRFVYGKVVFRQEACARNASPG